MSLLLNALRQVDQIKQGVPEQEADAGDEYTQNLKQLSVEIEELAQHVSVSAQTLLDDAPVLLQVAQQSIDDTYAQIKENNIPVLWPFEENIADETIPPPALIDNWQAFTLENVEPPAVEVEDYSKDSESLLTQIPHTEPMAIAVEVSREIVVEETVAEGTVAEGTVAEKTVATQTALSSEKIAADHHAQQKKIVDHLMRQHHRKQNWKHVLEISSILGLTVVLLWVWQITRQPLTPLAIAKPAEITAPVIAIELPAEQPSAEQPSAEIIVTAPAPPLPVAETPPVVPSEPIQTAAPIAQVAQKQPAGQTSAPTQQISTPKKARDDAPDMLNNQLQQAYQAFQNNDLSQAQQRYQHIIEHAPYNRDALLGLAAIAVAQKKNNEAMRYYLQLLQIDAQDDVAHSGVLSLSDMGSGPEVETELTAFAQRYPASSAMNFFLGTFYANHQQWPKAQRYFFKAYSLDNQNAHYAYNLAVSLDQIKQIAAALQYYQQALLLAAHQPLQFSLDDVRKRRDQLQSALPELR
jgi:hypothetical protein